MNRSRDDYSKLVTYGENDTPNKYGFTKKMNDIWDLVEDEKSPENVEFIVTEADMEFYKHYKWLYDREKEARGKPYHFPRYFEE